MALKEHFACFFVAILPLLILSMEDSIYDTSENDMLIQRKSLEIKSCHVKKTCEYSKEVLNGFKDFTLQFKTLVTSSEINQKDLMLISSYAGPIGGMLGVTVGIAAFVLDKQQKDEVKHAVELLNKKLDVLAIRIDNSAHKIIAHSVSLKFQESISDPANQLVKSYFEWFKKKTTESVNNFRISCKKHAPHYILNAMEKHLRDNADKTLLEEKYTDQAFSAYYMLFKDLMLEMILLYDTCEDLIHAKAHEEASAKHVTKDQDTIQKDRQEIRSEKILRITNLLEQINSTRAVFQRNINKLTVKRFLGKSLASLDLWYCEYVQLEIKERKKIEFSQRIVDKLNSDYKQFGYIYGVGIIKNREKKYNKLYSFACVEEVCHKKVKKDYVIWVLRTHTCEKEKQLHSSATACLRFQRELYGLYDTRILLHNNASNVLQTFMRNCRIFNAILLFKHSGRLRADTAGMAIHPKHVPKKEKLFKFKTEKPHRPLTFEHYLFGDTMVWADCYPEEPFNFFAEYCKAGTEWPYCILKETAFEYHKLIDRARPDGTVGKIEEIEDWIFG